MEDLKNKLNILESQKSDLEKELSDDKEGAIATIKEALGAGMSEEELLAKGFAKSEIDEAMGKGGEKIPTGGFRRPEKEQKPVGDKGYESLLERDSKQSDEKLKPSWKNKESTKEAKQKEIDARKAQIDNIYYKEDEKGQNDKLNSRLKEAGLSEYDFSQMPGWERFTYGQKMLVLEQASQETLANVKNIAKESFQEKNKKSWIGGKIWRNFGKAYYVAKEEKNAVFDAAQGKLMPKEEVLKSLVERMADMDLDVKEQNGKFMIQFEKLEKNLTPEQKQVIEAYNEVANEFARMPDSWKNEKAAKATDAFIKNNHKKYQEIRAKYEAARGALIESRKEQYGKEDNHSFEKAFPYSESEKNPSARAMLEAKDNDFQIAMLQFTNTHPDAVGELKRIHDQSALKNIFKDNETVWRGLYMGTGFAARSITASTLGLVAAPLVAGTIGGIRARRQANEKINQAFKEGAKEETFRERKGAGKEGLYDPKKTSGLNINLLRGSSVNAKEVAGFVDADSQIQRINNLMSKIDNASTPMQKAELMRQLTARIDFAQGKLESGLINYGSKNSIGENYAFLKLLSEAQIKSEIMDEKNPLDLTPAQIQALYEQTDRRKSLTEFVTNLNNAQREFNQRYFKNTETARGAVVGAGLSLLGWKIRDYFAHAPHGVKGLSYDNVPKEGSGYIPFVKDGEHSDFIDGKPVHEGLGDEKIHENLTGDHRSMEFKVGKGHGAIKTIREIQERLKTEYPDGSPRPASVEHILNTRAEKLAQEYGQYKPSNVNESAMERIGSSYKIDEQGNLTYHDAATNKDILLEKGTDIKASGTYEGKMFDSDHSGSRPNIENNLRGTPVPTGEEIDQTVPKIIDEGTPVPTGPEEIEPQGTPDIIDTHTSSSAIPEGANVEDKIDQGVGEARNAGENIKASVNPSNPNWTPRFANETGGVRPISPTSGNGNMYNPSNQEVQGNGFTREVPMTNRDASEFYGAKNIKVDEAITVREPNMVSDPRHLENADEVRREFGRQNVILDRPNTEYVNGMRTEEWNKYTDDMFREKGVKFDDYADYEKEKQLQEFFGHGEKGVMYDQELDKNVEGAHMYYYKETPEWQTVKNIPAKDFFDFNQNELVKNNPEKLNELIKGGIIEDKVSRSGVHNYSFTHEKELKRLAEVYAEKDPLNAAPIGNESMERYIGRITRDLHKTDDGTLYMFRDSRLEKSVDNGTYMDQKIEQEARLRSQPQGMRNSSPTGGGYYYSPRTINIANRANDIIGDFFGYSRWTH